MHLGNALSFVLCWVMARQRGWPVRMRVEDLDGPRVKAGAVAQAVEDLRWLQLDWDGPTLVQSDDLRPYAAALQGLRERGLIYPCRCTRKQVVAASAAAESVRSTEDGASAPHGDDHEVRYPGTCRPGDVPGAAGRPADGFTSAAPTPEAEAVLGDDDLAWRVRVPVGEVRFEDAWHGPQAVDVQGQVGDFVVATKSGVPAYQLAVVIDDARQGVGHVVRGDDLLRSTARQVLLHEMLGLGEPPRYYHGPLVCGPDGRRLAKRHGDTRLASYREAGVPATRVLGLIGRWLGLPPQDARTAAELAAGFDQRRLPRQTITMSEADHAWLIEGAG